MKSPVFFVGNKRCGTTALVNALNQHPDVFITQESDLLWLLYSKAVSGRFEYFPKDGIDGAGNTLIQAADILESGLSPRGKFDSATIHLLREGTPYTIADKEKQPTVLGDKKPESTTVALRWAVKNGFADAKVIHLTRHPDEFIKSVSNQPKLRKYWGDTDEKLFDKWVDFEERAINTICNTGVKSRHLQFFELINEPWNVLDDLWDFLEVDFNEEIEERVSKQDRFGIKQIETKSFNMRDYVY